jgi:hypothetical protein
MGPIDVRGRGANAFPATGWRRASPAKRCVHGGVAVDLALLGCLVAGYSLAGMLLGRPRRGRPLPL